MNRFAPENCLDKPCLNVLMSGGVLICYLCYGRAGGNTRTIFAFDSVNLTPHHPTSSLLLVNIHPPHLTRETGRCISGHSVEAKRSLFCARLVYAKWPHIPTRKTNPRPHPYSVDAKQPFLFLLSFRLDQMTTYATTGT